MSESELSKLLARVGKVTSIRGDKARLARDLGIPRQRLNDWLNGANAPTGEITLRLLKWVTAEEAKQKNAPEVRQHDRREKTRKSKSTLHEKAKSSSRK